MGADNYENLGFQVNIDGAETAVNHLNLIIERLEKIYKLQGKQLPTQTQGINEEKQTKRNTKALGSYISKMTVAIYVARRLARVVTSSIQESASYIENLNLFAVAYGDVYQETLDWALDLADSFGLASNEVLKFAGTFRQLSTSLGLVEDTANSVSKTVTQLGYDMSALFNTSVENAMEKLQSGLFSGNVRPLRAYGIDISQNQIDALFETNQQLAQLGVNARDLSQSDKVIARLIITLRDGANAFGTMNREINTLQSQIRILQGSFQNFKLAIGDFVYEPLRNTLIYVNAFVIAITDILRLFKPLQRTDENNIITSTATGAEEASEALDNLNGKLADFDKFNVLGGQSSGGSQLAVTEALTAELEKQQKLYQEQVDAMSKVTNQAKEMASKIIEAYGGADKIIEFFSNAQIQTIINNIFEVSKKLAPIIFDIAYIASDIVKELFPLILIVIDELLPVVQILLSTLKLSLDTSSSGLKSIISIFRVVANILSVLEPIFVITYDISWLISIIAKGIVFIGQFISIAVVAPLEAVVKVVETIAEVLNALFTWNWEGLGEKLSNLWDNWELKNYIDNLMDLSNFAPEYSIRGFVDGGYTNANLIMTHENGKREWVGKAAGSNAIVNDTQMSDIMEVAVAKGVVLGNRALANQGSDGSGVIHNHIYLDGKQIYEGVTDTAKKYGKKWATV